MDVVSPLTLSPHVRLLRSIQTSELIRKWAESYKIDVAGEFTNVSEIELYECEDTSLRFFRPLTVAGSARVYEALAQTNWYYDPEKWEHEVALASLNAGEKLLEVGCGEGAFVAECLKIGVAAMGIEINPKSVETAKKHNLPVELLDLQEAAQRYAAGFDVVCAFQVLEHVPNPREFLTWCIAAVKPGGRLILCVPNGDGFLRHISHLLDMPPHHMLQWTSKSFASLEGIFPLKLKKTLYEPLARRHVRSYVAAQCERAAKWSRLLRALATPIGRAIVAVPLFAGLRHALAGQSLYVEFERNS